MLEKGGIKNPSCLAFRNSRSRKIIGGQLQAILDPIFIIKQKDSPRRAEFSIRVAEIRCAARRLAASHVATSERARFLARHSQVQQRRVDVLDGAGNTLVVR